MGRGESNILYNPPSIKKVAKDNSSHGKYGYFPDNAGEVILGEGFIAFHNNKGSVRVLNEEMVADTQQTQTVSADGKMALFGNLLAWGDNEGFILKSLSDPQFHNSYYPGLPGKVLGIHLSGEHFYCLWIDLQGGQDTHLSRIKLVGSNPTEDANLAWEDLGLYSWDEAIHFANKGSEALLLYEDYQSRRYSFVRLGEEGPDGAIDVHQGRVRGKTPYRLVAAGDLKGEFFAAGHNWYNMPEVMVFSGENASGKPFSKGAKEEPLFSLEGLASDEALELAYSEGRGLLLANKELILFDKDNGILQVIELSKNDHFTRLSFCGERAILWNEGQDMYREFLLAK